MASVVLLMLMGFVLIIKGGDWFVSASVWLAEITKIPKILIGVTIVSIATTLPEIIVTLLAVSRGAYALGIGNAVGSVIANTGLIMSIALLFAPAYIDNKKIFYSQGCLMLVSAIWITYSLNDLFLSVEESIVLIILGIFYMYINIKSVKTKNLKPNRVITAKKTKQNKKEIAKNIFMFISGAFGIISGARLLVENGTDLAEILGVSQGIIGVTIVAVGTSLPELVTTITSIIKKQGSLGVGNIIGANIINLTLLMGTSGVITKNYLSVTNEYLSGINIIIPRTLYIDLPVTIALFVFLILPPIFMRGFLKRWQGGIMIIIYALFIAFLVANL